MQARARTSGERLAQRHKPAVVPPAATRGQAASSMKSRGPRPSSSRPFAQIPSFDCGMPWSYIGHEGSTWPRGADLREGSLHRSHTFASDQLNAVLLRSGGVTADTRCDHDTEKKRTADPAPSVLLTLLSPLRSAHSGDQRGDIGNSGAARCRSATRQHIASRYRCLGCHRPRRTDVCACDASLRLDQIFVTDKMIRATGGA